MYDLHNKSYIAVMFVLLYKCKCWMCAVQPCIQCMAWCGPMVRQCFCLRLILLGTSYEMSRPHSLPFLS